MVMKGGLSILVGCLVVVSILVVFLEWRAVRALAKDRGPGDRFPPGRALSGLGGEGEEDASAASADNNAAEPQKKAGFLSSFVKPHPLKELPSPQPPPFPKPPEVRHVKCRGVTYDTAGLPKTTLIIPYLHETWEQISKTMGSILTYTPPELLDEILFIDDGNEPEWQLHAEIKAISPKIRIHRNEERQGLIRSKVIGAAIVKETSPVIMFMEPHCVVNPQWLEPLLVHLAANKKHNVLVMPTLDIIPETDFSQYKAANQHIGGFDWSLTFNWMNIISERNKTYQFPEPYATPALSGGIFAMWRDYWEKMGTYDTNMTEWGGEHIEMSLRMWRCGGRIEIVPCSRIGHVFRAKNPYVVHPSLVVRNLKRAALVWLDENLEDFYRATPAAKFMDAGDVTERLQVKKNLQCESMTWYVDNIYPELKATQPRRR